MIYTSPETETPEASTPPEHPALTRVRDLPSIAEIQSDPRYPLLPMDQQHAVLDSARNDMQDAVNGLLQTGLVPREHLDTLSSQMVSQIAEGHARVDTQELPKSPEQQITDLRTSNQRLTGIKNEQIPRYTQSYNQFYDLAKKYGPEKMLELVSQVPEANIKPGTPDYWHGYSWAKLARDAGDAQKGDTAGSVADTLASSLAHGVSWIPGLHQIMADASIDPVPTSDFDPSNPDHLAMQRVLSDIKLHGFAKNNPWSQGVSAGVGTIASFAVPGKIAKGAMMLPGAVRAWTTGAKIAGLGKSAGILGDVLGMAAIARAENLDAGKTGLTDTLKTTAAIAAAMAAGHVASKGVLNLFGKRLVGGWRFSPIVRPLIAAAAGGASFEGMDLGSRVIEAGKEMTEGKTLANALADAYLGKPEFHDGKAVRPGFDTRQMAINVALGVAPTLGNHAIARQYLTNLAYAHAYMEGLPKIFGNAKLSPEHQKLAVAELARAFGATNEKDVADFQSDLTDFGRYWKSMNGAASYAKLAAESRQAAADSRAQGFTEQADALDKRADVFTKAAENMPMPDAEAAKPEPAPEPAAQTPAEPATPPEAALVTETKPTKGVDPKNEKPTAEQEAAASPEEKVPGVPTPIDTNQSVQLPVAEPAPKPEAGAKEGAKAQAEKDQGTLLSPASVRSGVTSSPEARALADSVGTSPDTAKLNETADSALKSQPESVQKAVASAVEKHGLNTFGSAVEAALKNTTDKGIRLHLESLQRAMKELGIADTPILRSWFSPSPGSYFENGAVSINPLTGDVGTAVRHELTHAVTAGLDAAFRKGELKGAQLLGYIEMLTAQDAARAALPKFLRDALDAAPKDYASQRAAFMAQADKMGDKRDSFVQHYYGSALPQEWIPQTFTSPEHLSFIASVPLTPLQMARIQMEAKPQSLFDSVITALRKMITGKDIPRTSAAGAAYENALKMILLPARSVAPAGAAPLQSPENRDEPRQLKGANLRRMVSVLGESMYAKNLWHTIGKEVFQNAVDAVKSTGEQGVITYGPTGEGFRMVDNGPGMLPNQIVEKFLPAFETGKGVGEGGGFGMAKLAFLGGPEKWNVVTIAKTPNGRMLRTTLNGTGAAYLDFVTNPPSVQMKLGEPIELANGMTMQSEFVEAPHTGTVLNFTGSGTSYKAVDFVDTAKDFVPEVKFSKHYWKFSDPGLGNSLSETYDAKSGDAKWGKLHTVELPEATIDIIAKEGSPEKVTKATNISYLNRSILQFRDYVILSGDGVLIPSDIAVNIKPKVEAGTVEYPFTTNRETVTQNIKNAVSEYLNSIGEKAKEALHSKFAEARAGSAVIPGSPFHLFDVGGNVPKEIAQEIASAPETLDITQDVQRIQDAIVKTLQRKLGPKYGRATFSGLMTAANAYGVHFGKGDGPSQIYHDPWLTFAKAKSELAEQMGRGEIDVGGDYEQTLYDAFLAKTAGISLHEALHQGIHSEGEDLARGLTFNAGDIVDTVVSLIKTERPNEHTTRINDFLTETGNRLATYVDAEKAGRVFRAQGGYQGYTFEKQGPSGERPARDDEGRVKPEKLFSPGETSPFAEPEAFRNWFDANYSRLREWVMDPSSVPGGIAREISTGETKGIAKAAMNTVSSLAAQAKEQTFTTLRQDFGTKTVKNETSGQTKAREAAEAFDRQAASLVAEAGGSKARLKEFRDLIADSNDAKLAKKYTPIADHALTHFDRLVGRLGHYRELMADNLKRLKDAGIKIAEWEDYVTHAWKNQGLPENAMIPDPMFSMGSGAGRGAGYVTKGRTVASLAEGIHIGLDPQTLDIASLGSENARATETLLQQREFIKKFEALPSPTDGKPIFGKMEPVETIKSREAKQTGAEREVLGQEPLTGQPGDEMRVPRGYTKITGFGKDLIVHHDFEPVFESFFGKSAVRNHPIGRALLKTAAYVKSYTLMLDLYHAMRIGVRGFFAGAGSGYNKGRALAEYAPEDLNRAVENGEIAPETADFHKANYEKYQELLKAGLNVGKWNDNLMEQANIHVPFLSGVNEWIFSKVSRGVGIQTALAKYERIKANNKDLSQEEAARKTALETNEYLGNLGHQSHLGSKTFQDMARIILLAPSWMEGMARAEFRGYAQGLKGGYKLATTGSFGGADALRTMALASVAFFAANQVVNLITRHQLTTDNPEDGHKLDAFIPIGPNGLFFEPFQYTNEFMKAFFRSVSKQGNAADAVMAIGGNKLAPMARAVKGYALNKDVYGHTFESETDRIRGLVTGLIPMPIPVAPWIKNDPRATFGYALNREEGSAAKQIAQLGGVKLATGESARTRMFAVAGDYRAERIRSDMGGEYTNLRRALDNNDNDSALDEIRFLAARGKSLHQIRESVGIASDGHTERELFTGKKSDEQAMLRDPKFKPHLALYKQAQADHARNAVRFRALYAKHAKELAPLFVKKKVGK